MKQLLTLLLIGSISLYAQTVPSYVPTNGLVGWWPFNGNANDESGNGYNATNQNAQLTMDRFGSVNKAFNFQSNGYLIGSSVGWPSGNSPRSLSIWYFGTNLGQNIANVCGKQLMGYGGTSCGNNFIVNFDNCDIGANSLGKLEVQGHCLAFRSYINQPTPFNTIWHHLVITYDGTILKFYTDGALVSTINGIIMNTGQNSDSKFTFGTQVNASGSAPYNDPSWPSFNGKIDDVGIWNRALSQQEIESIFNSTLCISDVPTITTETACGPESVTMNATWANTTSQQHIWLSPTGVIRGRGATFTTPVLTASSTQDSRLIVRNTGVTAVSGGPAITLTTPTGGGGNFTNGMWFTATQPFMLDSVTVRAIATANGGVVKFLVRISEKAGTHAASTGAQLYLSDTITVSTTLTTGELFRVPVNIPVLPGSYYVNINFVAGTTGQLFRSTALPTGTTYPYPLGGLGSLDSVQIGTTGSNTRVYYLFNWKMSAACLGPIVTTSVPFLPLPSNSLPHLTNFTTGLPCNWQNSSNGASWQSKIGYSGNGYTSTSLNGTSFMMIDDNAAGLGITTLNSSFNTIEFPALVYDTLTLRFKNVFKANGGRGYVEVWRPVNGVFSWIAIDSLSNDQGIGTPSNGWQAVTRSYNLASYQSNNLKVRFRFNDQGLVAGWWAIDDFELLGTKSPTGNVRVAVTTDIYGSEVSWKIVNTANKLVYASKGQFNDVTPYVAATATHIDTVALPLVGQYEFRITDAYGDGLYDGTNTGTYLAQVLCPNSFKIIDQGSGALPNDPGGSSANVPSWDSAVFDMGCSSIAPPTTIPSITYCQGAVAAQLTATALPSAILKWFDGQFNPLTQAPIPSTLVSGTTTYYVGQLTLNGISAIIPIVVTVNPLPVVNVGPDVAVCAGTPVTLSGSGASIYTWNNGITDAVAFTPTATTTYTVTGTDTNGCVNTDQVVVTVNPLPSPPVANNISYCQNATATQLTATTSTGSTLNWGTTYPLPTGISLSVLSPASIQGIIPHSNNGNTTGWGLANLTNTFIIDTVVVMDDSTSGVNTVVGTNPNMGNSYPGIPLKYEGCNLDTTSAWQTSRLAGKIVLIARGTCEFGIKVFLAQRAGARAVILYNRDNALLNLAPGAYGALTTIPFASITRPQGDSLRLMIESGQTVVAFLGNGTGGTYGGSSNVAPIPSTSIPGSFPYYVSQTNALGCRSVNDTIMVTVNPLPVVNAGTDVTVCAGTPVTLSGSGASTYTWNNAVGNAVAFTPTATTTYTVTGTDANGCVNVDSAVVTVNVMPDTTVTVTGSLAFCPGSSVLLSAASGLDYLWSTGDTTQSVTLSQSGTAYAVVTTVNGCMDTTASFTTLLYPGADTSITASNLIFCASDSSVITAAAGQSYAWNTGDTTQSITVNQTGNYAVTVTTVNGCVGVSDTVATTVVPDVVLPQILGDLYGWFASGDTVNFSVVNNGGYTLNWGITGGVITGGQGGDTIAVIWGAADSTAAIWVVVSNGVCQDSAYLNLVISGLGTGEGIGSKAMAYPNPNSGVFTLEWSNIDAQQVLIYNGVGQVVASQAIAQGSTSTVIDLSAKAAGIYRAVIYGIEGTVTLPVYVRH